jgi:GntR family transcriptional regulator
MGHSDAASVVLRKDPAAAVTDFVPPEFDLTHNRAPIYVQLSTLFRRFIVTGHWPVDRQVPTHETLAAQFDVNPATIRKAIAMLEDEGLVKRYRRHGTFVTAKPALADWFRIGTIWDEAVRSFDGLSIDVIAQSDTDKVPEPFHGAEVPAAAYRYLRRLYSRAGAPIMVEDAYLDQALRRKIGDAKLSSMPTLALLDTQPNLKIERADETVRFGIADTEISAILGIPLNAPVAIVHHSVFGEKSRLQYESCAYLRGDIALVSEPIKFAGSDK